MKIVDTVLLFIDGINLIFNSPSFCWRCEKIYSRNEQKNIKFSHIIYEILRYITLNFYGKISWLSLELFVLGAFTLREKEKNSLVCLRFYFHKERYCNAY